MDGCIKIFSKHEKERETLRIQRNGIWNLTICHVDKKGKERRNRRNWTVKLGNNQNT